jgi:hypothetical protein
LDDETAIIAFRNKQGKSLPEVHTPKAKLTSESGENRPEEVDLDLIIGRIIREDCKFLKFMP